MSEWRDNWSVISAKRPELLDRINKIFQPSLNRTHADCRIHTLQSSRLATAKQPKGKYLMQRYVESWKTYVNVDNIQQIGNRDTLTITQPSLVSAAESVSHVQSKSNTKIIEYMHACS